MLESPRLRKKFSMLRVAETPVPGQSARDFRLTIVDEDGINRGGEKTVERERERERERENRKER